MPKSEKMIFLTLSVTVIIMGLNMAMIKYLVLYLDPALLSGLRNTIAGIVMLPFVWKMYGFYKPNPKQWGLLFLIGLTSYSSHQVLVGHALFTTTATNAALIMGLYPLFTALLAAFFLGENFQLKLGVGIVLGFTGVFLAVTSKSDGSLGFSGWGDVLLFLSMLAYVVGSLFVKKISDTPIPNSVTTAYSFMFGGAISNLLFLFSYGPSAYLQMPSSWTVWGILLLSAWGSCTLANLWWNNGIKILGANRTGMFQNGIPIAGMFGGYVFMNETIGWIHLLALILVMAGIILGAKKKGSSGAAALNV